MALPDLRLDGIAPVNLADLAAWAGERVRTATL
jgi:hypothetical protein